MTITPQLVAKYPLPSREHASTSVDLSGPLPRLWVRTAESLRLHELGERAVLGAEFPLPPAARSVREWVAPDLSCAVFAVDGVYVAVGRDGTRLWEQPYGGWAVEQWGYVDFSTLGARPGDSGGELRIWLRLPSGLPDSTLILTLDAEGTVLARNMIPCGGYERFVSLHWRADGEPVGVRVSGGLHGPTDHHARWESGRIVLGRPMTGPGERLQRERDLLDTDPQSALCMTRDRRGRDVSWHRLPSYERTAVLSLADFPAPGTGDCSVHDAPWISGWGGFVDAGTAMVTLHNSFDEARVLRFGEDVWEEHSHWLADPVTGTLHGRIEYPMRDVDSVTPLGDGTWMTTEWDALHRWRAPRS
ncbi:hypothetical protein [Saccharothrix sp. ST-888]|uniref:hypothetical protein n=1 Tax=Saccharothrix sp. ST-888 TaxID=1427391 RepID=UPI0005ED3251|nr:hypothetical protein [Saccharothrix sp. ST-888]KJK57432.1 hypothetical protein UK12_16645 [Saccharothrix sp. ST-888]